MGFDAANRIDKLCDEFEQAFKAGGKPEIEAFLSRIEERHRPALLRDLVGLEAELRAGVNDRPRVAEYLQRFPDHKSDVEAPYYALRVWCAVARPSCSWVKEEQHRASLAHPTS
jgi:hypothetical protein